MDSGKQQQGLSSETSSEENDRSSSSSEHQQQVKEKRCYECTFCKRGFTNAQALGGHMNIHRKDRAAAKAKHHPASAPSSHSQVISNIEDSSHHDHDHDLDHHCAPFMEYYSERSRMHMMINTTTNCHMPGSATLDLPYHNNNYNSFASSRSSPNQHQLLGANLSLTIDSSRFQADIDEVGNSDEVDLELRLGHG